jgi:hypothetical protein
MFEEAHATGESPGQVQVPISARIVFCLWAMLVAMLPAATAAYSAFRVINSFRNMTNAEEAGSEWVLRHLHGANIPLVIALAISSLLAFGLGIALAINQKRRLAGVGLPLSMAIPALAVTPALFLWSAESKIIGVLSGDIMNFSATDYALTIPSLLLLAIASGLVVQGLAFVCAVVSLFISPERRADAVSGPRVFIWFVSGVLIALCAVLVFITA